MTNKMLVWFKYTLTIVGERLPFGLFRRVQALFNYLLLGRWMRQHGFVFHHRVRNREEVWKAVVDRISATPVLYLEFGVFEGASIRFWSDALRDPGTRIHGFDSFEGLPAAGGPWSMGQFDVQGNMPSVPDQRVQFFKGWFDQVLPNYQVPPHDVLIINMDADLYSSTIYVLRHLRPWIKPGTFLYFDEMNHLEHEPRALEDFMNESGLRFRGVSADLSLAFVFLECI